MSTRPRTHLMRPIRAVIVVGVIAAAVAALSTSPSASAAPGAQARPSLVPEAVEAASSPFSLAVGGGAFCDGTGGEGWRAHTFIVDAGVDVSELDFGGGPLPGYIAFDPDASDGTLAAPLHAGEAAVVNLLPAATPAGLINPDSLTAFDFDPAATWNLVDGDYQIGFACVDGPGVTRQWWSLTVTIDADATPGPFMVAKDVGSEPVETSVAVAADPSGGAAEGSEVTFTATVAPAGASGTVDFLVDGAAAGSSSVAGGTASFTTSALAVGTRSITADFTPTDPSAFTASSGSLDYTISAAGAEATTVTLSADPADGSLEGQSVTLAATVTPTAAAGAVTFTADGIALGPPVDVDSGQATMNTSELEIGDLTLMASFAPSDASAYTGSSATLAYSVADADGVETTMTLTADPADGAAVGAEVTFTAEVEPSVAGSVSFTDGEESMGAPVTVADGVAALTTTSLTEGAHEVTAEFTPEDAESYLPSSASLTYTVGSSTSTTGLGETTTTSGPGGGGSLPSTGAGLRLLAVAVLLVCLGRIAVLAARPSSSAAER